MKNKKIYMFKDAAIMLTFVAVATVLGWIFRIFNLHETNIVVLYILSVVMTARFTNGYLDGILVSILSVIVFNWFFTEPYYTLKINDLNYIVTFITMAITAIFTSGLTSKFKKAAIDSKRKEEETKILYQMTNHLTDAEDIPAIAKIIVKTSSDILSCNAACICFDENGEPEKTFIQQKDGDIQIRRELDETPDLKWRMENLQGKYDIGREFYDWPIRGKDGILGVLRIPNETAKYITDIQEKLILAVIESAALAMERFRSLQAQARSREEIEQERYRGNLLRAISHDIRTPLSGIIGSSEMILTMLDKENPCYQLVEGIYKDADWLHSLVENILSLTRLQDGRMKLEKEFEAVEEVVGAAISTIEKRAPEREIHVDMPDNVVMIPMNARLIHQVLVNLLDNAIKHSPNQTTINISVYVNEKENRVYFSVRDRGTGLSEEEIPKIFQMFYTKRDKSADSKLGIGLGLSICKSIVKAHGGEIFAKNRAEGPGAEFTFTLPIKEEIKDGNAK